MKLYNYFIAAITTCVLANSPVEAASVNGSSVKTDTVSPVELTYQDSQYGCGNGNVDITVDVIQNDKVLRTLSKGESILLKEGINGISFKYTDSRCGFGVSSAEEYHYKNGEAVPNVPGAYSQTSLQTIVNNLESYEDLYLAELGTSNKRSQYYDLQDVIFIVNNNPFNNETVNNKILFAD